MKIKYIVYTILILGVAALIAYRISKNTGQKQTATKGKGPSVVKVDGIIADTTGFANTLSVSGNIEAEQQVQIISQVAGIVKQLYFKEGSYVQKGQVLLTIDDIELRAQLAQAKTRENLATETEKRASLLIKSGAISQQEYDVARAELKSMQSATQLINAQISKTQVRAPFSGRIGLSTLAVGEYLEPSTLIANLVSIDPIKLSFSIPEKYSSQVKPNTKVNFTVSSSDKQYTATVYAIEPGIETVTRTLQLKAKAANPDGVLLPGAFAKVELPISYVHNAILVPTEAVVPIQNGQKVYIAENGKAKEVMVTTATRTDKDILVTEGLQPGDTVVTTGNMALKPGTPIHVTINKPTR